MSLTDLTAEPTDTTALVSVNPIAIAISPEISLTELLSNLLTP